MVHGSSAFQYSHSVHTVHEVIPGGTNLPHLSVVCGLTLGWFPLPPHLSQHTVLGGRDKVMRKSLELEPCNNIEKFHI